MAFKIANILTSSLCLLVSLSCYAQDGTEEMPPVKRIRKSSWSLLRITIPPYTEARDEEKKKPRCPPAPKKAFVRPSFHTSTSRMKRRSSRLINQARKKNLIHPQSCPPKTETGGG